MLTVFDEILSSAPDIVLRHDVTATIPDAYTFALRYTGGTVTNGPPTQPTYRNDVWCWGPNVQDAGVPLDPTKHYVAFHMEFKFYDGVNFGSEVHLETVDLKGNFHRPMTFFLPHDGGARQGVSWQDDYFSLQTYSGVPKVNFRTKDNIVDISDGTVFSFVKNNTVVATQLNAAANASLSLPYINNADTLVVSQPILVQAKAPPSNIVNFYQVLGTAPNGASVFAVSAVGAGIVYGLNISASSPSRLINYLYNQSTGNAENELAVQSEAGDPKTRYTVIGGSNGWVAGIDNSDGDNYKISVNDFTPPNDAFVIESSAPNRIKLGGPVKLGSFTVTTAPSPSAMEAGAIIFVSNGDFGAPCLAVSDGATWRRVALGATISAT